jgi:hypothetical protein
MVLYLSLTKVKKKNFCFIVIAIMRLNSNWPKLSLIFIESDLHIVCQISVAK